MSKQVEGINERLINEYISKVGCCDECFASVYCTVNGLRESRGPQDYCVENIKRYFCDKANPNIDPDDGDLISRSALKKSIKSYADDQYAENEYLGEYAIMNIIDNALTVEAYTPDQVKELVDLNKKLSEERPQGEWVKVKEYRMSIDMSGEIATLYKCSECGRTIAILPSKLSNYPFCHCGADMRKGDTK